MAKFVDYLFSSLITQEQPGRQSIIVFVFHFSGDVCWDIASLMSLHANVLVFFQARPLWTCLPLFSNGHLVDSLFFARSYRLGFVVNVLSLCVLMFSLFVTPLTETVVACAALFPWEQPSFFKAGVYQSRFTRASVGKQSRS